MEVHKCLTGTTQKNGLNYADVFNGFDDRNSGGIVLTELDKDGIYEIYLNERAGSGIIHEYVHGYNPVSKKYYSLGNKVETDYRFFIREKKVYVFSNEDRVNHVQICWPLLSNDELFLEPIAEKNVMKSGEQ